jgi:carboxymethylenebutenolidase
MINLSSTVLAFISAEPLTAYDPELWNYVASTLPSVPTIVGGVVYSHVSNSSSLKSAVVPVLRHTAGKRPDAAERQDLVKSFYYPNATSHQFASPFQDQFDYWAESVSHTRTLQFLKPIMNGPYFDLETIWEEHTYYEFADRSVEHTMSTMVDQPYVNHVPTVCRSIHEFQPIKKSNQIIAYRRDRS